MNLVDIAKSWYSFIKAEPKDLEVAQERIAICDDCPDKVQMTELGQLVMNSCMFPILIVTSKYFSAFSKVSSI